MAELSFSRAEPLSCLLNSLSPSLSAPFTRPSLFLFVQREGDRGRSLSTCCGYKVFCKGPGLNTSVHCVNSPQSLVVPFSGGPPLCGGSLWPSEGYCAAKRRAEQKARPPGIVAFSRNMQRIHLCCWPTAGGC